MSRKKIPEKLSHLLFHTAESLFIFCQPLQTKKFRTSAKTTWWEMDVMTPLRSRLSSVTCSCIQRHTDSVLLWSLQFVLKNILYLLLTLRVLRGPLSNRLAGVSNLWPVGCMHPRIAMNVPQHKIVNFLKTLWDFFVITCCNIFNVWPKTTLLLPVWPREAKSLDTSALEFRSTAEFTGKEQLVND